MTWEMKGGKVLKNVLFFQSSYVMRLYTSRFGSVMFLVEHRRELEQEAERTGTHKTQTTTPSLTESWCRVIWE